MKESDGDQHKIESHLQNAVNLKQNCKIYIATKRGASFSFYFKKGNLLWASSSIHRFSRLYRISNQICPEVNCQEVKLREQEISELWEYLLIRVLYKRKQITEKQAQKIIKAVIKEVLFDCLIAKEQIDKVKVIFETTGNQMGAILKSSLFQQPIALVSYQKIYQRLESSVVDWHNTKLVNCSPNHAPVIKDINKLQKTVSPELYQQLFVFINGQKTLRDLAWTTQKKISSIVNTLLPHIQNKAISLQEIPDRHLQNLYFAPSNANQQDKDRPSDREYIQELELPLVICVDDNPNVCQDIAQILNPVGYRILPVNDAAKALIVLMENQPSLIYLDTEMPDANGYELCAQIKKMPAFKHIPIIILSDRENMVDRVRGKIVGASDILSKPIDTVSLLTMTQKYTQNVVDRQALAAQEN